MTLITKTVADYIRPNLYDFMTLSFSRLFSTKSDLSASTQIHLPKP
ncbi:hypothetical protein AYX15_07163 [Cryptococcus neoformans]|nr:hypothetical protein AYX15_07163 [Cryptococcus neoformans var. grubii]